MLYLLKLQIPLQYFLLPLAPIQEESHHFVGDDEEESLLQKVEIPKLLESVASFPSLACAPAVRQLLILEIIHIIIKDLASISTKDNI